jgi:hypothetical protein
MALAVAAVLVGTSAALAVAGLSGHSGTRGVHLLLDGSEYPGHMCQYASASPGALQRISVRRPVIYAPDVTAGRDQRWVGWRLRLQRSSNGILWDGFHTSNIRKAIAYDDQPAILDPRGKNVAGDPGLQYRAVVDFYWYTATSSTKQTGRAVHVPRWSAIIFGSGGTEQGPCPGAIGTAAGRAAPAGAGAHSGPYGLHTLIDVREE